MIVETTSPGYNYKSIEFICECVGLEVLKGSRVVSDAKILCQIQKNISYKILLGSFFTKSVESETPSD